MRRLVLAGFEVPAQLGQGDDRDLKFTVRPESLEATADLGHLDLSVLGLCPAGHQLEVVDDDDAEIPLGLLEPAGPGPDVHHRGVGVVVDEDGRVGELGDGDADLAPVLGAGSGPVCARLCPFTSASDASRRCVEFAGGPSRARRGAGRSLFHHAHVGQHTQGEAGLSHAGAGAHDVEGGGLEAQRDLVELAEAAGHAGDVGSRAGRELLNAVQTLLSKSHATSAMESAVRRSATLNIICSASSMAPSTFSGME